METIETTINELKLDTPIFNASGCMCTTHDDLVKLYDCKDCGAIISKSSTINHRDGNPHPRYYENKLGSINSTGLANNGYMFYEKYRKEWRNKPFFLSIAVDKNIIKILDNIENDNIEFDRNINPLELNISCPNLIGKPQLSYNFEEMDETLRIIFEKGYSMNMGLKLSPYFDPLHIDLASDIIKKYNINHITTINSIGNGLLIDIEKQKPCIKPKNGLGGIGGDYCKPTALANVYCFNKNIGSKIDIIGCGGVKTGTDVFEHILCGAKAVQVGTHLLKNGPECFGGLNTKLKEEMIKHNYKNIEEFRGTIQNY